ncbi:MAG: C-terminal binding protein [Pirellulales bacterium]|nr:C-terminal binding protein [Pirellulales bacterium]
MTHRFHVVITDFINDELQPEKDILGELSDVVALDAMSEEQLSGRIETADALLVYHNLGISRRSIERLGGCRLIVRCGVGYNNIDCLAARERGIPVANVPDYGSEEVADSALGMMLALSRGIALYNSRLRDGIEPWFYTQAVPLRRLRGRTFAVVGLGRIGTAAALRAKALGMDVVFYDPYRPDGYDKALGIRRETRWDALLAQAYVLSLHCPLTDETRHMVDRAALAQMPAGGYLINTARGGIVDGAAVVEAVESGRLAGAGIDVLEKEPPPPDDPLVQAWRNPRHPAYHRVLLNPHAAFYSEEALGEMRTKGALAARCALRGEPIPNVVNGVT